MRRHVLRYIHYDGTRPTRIRNKECLLHCGSEIVYIPDQEIVLHTRSRDSYGVDLLKGIVPDQMSWDLASQNDHRDRIHIRRRNSGHGVGNAWARSHQHNAGLTGGPSIPIGRMSRGLFVSYQDMTHIFLAIERVVNVKRRTSGITENQFDAFIFQALDDDLRAGQLH